MKRVGPSLTTAEHPPRLRARQARRQKSAPMGWGKTEPMNGRSQPSPHEPGQDFRARIGRKKPSKQEGRSNPSDRIRDFVGR